MTRDGRALSMMLIALLGMWGCAKGPAGHSADRLRTLEAKCGKLEDDYRAVAHARDQARKQLVALETERTRLQKEFAAAARERDELRQQITTRTSERDTLQLRCDRMKKGLQNLLGQDDALLPAPPTTSSSRAAALTPTQS